MSTKTKSTLTLALLAILFAFNASGPHAFAAETGRRHHGPPPEAFSACEGKNAGDRAEFTSPRGDRVTGTCVERNDRLVLRPDTPPRGSRATDSGN